MENNNCGGISPNNTANSRCRYDMMTLVKCILLPMDARYTGVGNQTIDQWLEEGIHSANPSNRFYPMPEFSGAEDQSEEDVEWTDPYGNKYPIRDGKPTFTQSYMRDFCLSKRLATGFNDNQHRRVLIIDESGKLWGCQKDDGFTGFEVVIKCKFPKIPTATELSEGTITYYLQKPAEFNKNRVAMNLESDEDVFVGLEDVDLVATMSTVQAEKNKVWYVKLFVNCGENQEDITSLFKTTFTEDSLWKADNAAIGATIEYDTARDAFKLTYATALTSGSSKTISIVDPATLYANTTPIKGYEFGSVKITYQA